ncbi:gag-polypeptide of LTR copia-type domain-containing protein [Phthorimaea operculella]|nr:gag-polypeptide of LTR copia-type domain-containing protein [Phthorimaea operculella]
MVLVKEKLFAYTSEAPADDPKEKEKDEEALALICLHIEPHLYPYVKDATSAKSAWDSLSTAFEDKGINRRLSLLNALLDERYDKYGSMHDYVSSVMNHAQKLEEIGKGLDDDLVAIVLLRGLPDEFQPMRMAMEHSGMELTSEKVRVKLLQEDMRQSTSAGSSGAAHGAALVSKGKGKPHKQATSKVRCFRCGAKGHRKPDCPMDENNRSTKSKNCLMTSFSASSSFDPVDWYLDSGASNHMSFQRNWFQNFVAINNNNDVTCANNDKLSSAGKGDIEIRLNGECMTVKSCAFVPGLKVNLLSVSMMVKRGWKVNFDETGCKLYLQSMGSRCGGSNKLVATATEVSGIYRLDNCVPVVEGALGTVQAGNSLSLWHKRLGHVNVNDLRKLPGIDGGEVMEPCVSCIKGKALLPFHWTGQLGLVHADLCIRWFALWYDR